MNFEFTLSQRELICLAIASGTWLFLWLVAELLLRQRRRRLLAEQLNQVRHETELEKALLEQDRDHAQDYGRRLEQQLRLAQEQVSEQQQSIVDCERELATALAVAEKMPQVEQRLIEREAELRRLLAELEATRAGADAEKSALEDKLRMLQDARQQLSAEFKLLANQIFDDKQQHFRTQSTASIDASISPLKQQLDAFRQKVEDVYERENGARNQLLGQIVELQKHTQEIGRDALNLTRALKGDNKTQGNWGELILERVLESSGLEKGREFELQVTLKDPDGGRRQPDALIHLPDQRQLVVDAKVSLKAYESWVNTTEESARRELMSAHLQSIRSHVQGLSEKGYQQLEGLRTVDFVFLFIPVESAYLAALQADANLFQQASEKRIILVCPTTLLAALRTVESIWRYQKQNRHAEEIAAQAGGLHDQFVLLFESLGELGRQLERGVVTHQTVMKRLGSGRGNLLARVDGLRRLGAKARKQLPDAGCEDAEMPLVMDESAPEEEEVSASQSPVPLTNLRR